LADVLLLEVGHRVDVVPQAGRRVPVPELALGHGDRRPLPGELGGVAVTQVRRCSVWRAHRISVINAGRIIESYPERRRCLILGTTPDGLPFHIVVECTGDDWITIVSNYVPDARYWKGDWATRRPGKPRFND
jgi:hypothetical protein